MIWLWASDNTEISPAVLPEVGWVRYLDTPLGTSVKMIGDQNYHFTTFQQVCKTKIHCIRTLDMLTDVKNSG